MTSSLPRRSQEADEPDELYMNRTRPHAVTLVSSHHTDVCSSVHVYWFSDFVQREEARTLRPSLFQSVSSSSIMENLWIFTGCDGVVPGTRADLMPGY